jgi:hypothetical protein
LSWKSILLRRKAPQKPTFWRVTPEPELLRSFGDLKIIHYEDVRDEVDWAPGQKSRIVRFIAEKPDGDRTP